LRQLCVFFAFLCAARGAEPDALEISADIRARHLPHGTVLDPFLGTGGEITGYTRCGDSAIWTGHYLAAEAYRYAVTGSAEALEAARGALEGLRGLVDVTGTGLLARCAIPADSPWAAGILEEERSNGIYPGLLGGKNHYWIGNTSRDQYSGALFGLAAAYDLVPALRDPARELAGRLLRFLIDHRWSVVMPDRSLSTTFVARPDQQLALLAIGRHLDPRRFDSAYKSMRSGVGLLALAPVSAEVLDDHHSYYKFNLDTINLFSLVRLEESSFWRSWYLRAYDVLRRTTDDHGNAHFNMIDRALKGADTRRDAETAALLDAWLLRPRTDQWVDWRTKVQACGEDRACRPLPVQDRVRTDFLWQRSPFLLYGGGAGNIQSAGIDYILPYWMARYYQVVKP
jgi:hypothetical protein